MILYLFYDFYITYIYYDSDLSNRCQTDRKSEKNLSDAVQKRETIALRLSKDALAGNDTLYEPSNVVKKISQKSSITKGYGY